MIESRGGPSHRIGRRTQLIDLASASRAPLAELMAAASEPERCAEVASTARFVVRTRAGQVTLSKGEAAALRPDDLLPTRRPASYRGMRNFIGRVCVPAASGDTAVWFESLNERSHLRDLLLTQPVAGLATQPVLVVWTLPSGVRRHYPDILIRNADDTVMACDVTRRDRLVQAAALAQFTLMAATARAVGWDFEVRTELPAQRVRNQSHVYACRHADPADRARWIRATGAGPAEGTLGEFAARCGGGSFGLGAALHLASQRELSLDFDAAITSESHTRRGCVHAADPAWVHRL